MPAASEPALYDVLVGLHVTCAVVGFGAVAISGVYGALARHPDASEETRRYFASRGWAEWLLLAVPFLGAGALLDRRENDSFSQVWVVGGSALWLVAAALLILVVRPAAARIRAGDGVAAAGRSLMWAGAASDVLFVVALALMVTQPG